MPAEAIRQKLLGKFREVTADRVEKISSQLLELERAVNAEAMQDLARELHTLKGESRMMGFPGISQVMHAAEELLRVLSPGKPGPEIDALLKACDTIPGFLDGPPDGGEAARALVERLHLLAVPLAAKAMAAPPAEVATPSITPVPAAEPRGDRPAGSIRVNVDRLDEIAAVAGDLLVEGARAQSRTRELAGLLARWTQISDQMLAITEEAHDVESAGVAQRIEGDIHTLRSDTFRFLRGHSDAVSATCSQLGVLADRVGAARLVPLSGILAGFPRAARDLARDQGKEIECTVKGGETGVDKTILLSLNDPLVHLLRNAVDHGVEPPEERERMGKPRAGRIEITARIEGDLLVVTLSDDGRGVDPQQVREAALRRGIISANQSESLSPRAAMDLIFLPGFSTREKAGEVSGRGVGLDVVRQKVVALGGSVLVDSEPDKGTRFTLRVPQSLALMKVLLVRLDNDVYGFPAADVESVGRIDTTSISELAGIPVVRHGERLLPVVALGPLLGLNEGPRHPRPAVVFVHHGTEAVALLVDGLQGGRDAAVKTPGVFVKGMRFVAGAVALENGNVALLLSTPHVVAAACQTAGAAPSGRRERRHLNILLVDDSAIARDTEAALLRSLGHQVDEAIDGEDGWRKLQAGNYQLLLTDVQMPVLDGIGLVQRVKTSSRFGGLPVVILSALTGPEDRRRGVNAGADAYLAKSDLDPETLAATLERLCGVVR